MPMTVLEIDDLDVALGGIPILKGVSLGVDAGEIVALMGGNGSGKSTLIRAALGLVEHQRGEVTLFGTPLARFREWARVGYVPQRANVALHATAVGELVASGRLARRRPFVPASKADRAAAAAALDRVGLAHKRSEPFVHLSGGQQQRVLIARALAGEPDFLVLDEPFVGVDLATQDALAAMVADLRDEGHSVLVVVHEQGPFATLIDRTVTLVEGRTADGHHPHDDDHHHEAAGPVALVEEVTPWSY
jgi:zinc transport system ATP-binding protein